jgi:hypothetical protein
MSDLREVIKHEYKRCATSFSHCAKRYFKIQHPTKGKVNFNLYDFQEKAVNEFISHRYNIILKGRQLGLSTLVAAYALWKMIFNNDFKVLVIATTQDVAKELVAKVQYMYDNLPVWMKSTVKENTFNKLELTFKNGSSIKAVSSSEKSARSPSISLLIIDEAASQATLATGGDCIILSTPNGVGNKFHQMWVDAMEGNQGLDSEPFNPIKIPWNVHPERDQKWADEQLAKLGKRNFAQEHDCDFISSGHTVIDGEILQWYKENVVMEPIERRYANDLWIWKYPVVGRDYIVCADVSRGDGEDYSAFHVFDVDTLEQVAEYRGKVDTRSYGHLLVSIATEYNNALLAIDNSNMGWDVVQVALDLNYSNLYYSYKNDPI